MLNLLFRNIKNLYEKKINGYGLAVFRIAYSLVLLGEVMQMFYFRHLIFDKIPFILLGEIDMWPLLIFWMVAIVFLIFGFFARTAAIINYILSVSVLGTISSFEYHMFYVYIGVNFLLIFIPVSRCLSMDRLLLKLRYSNTRFTYEPPIAVSVLAYYIPLLISVGFIYIDSVLFKLKSSLWINGLGLWLPASLPQTMFMDSSVLLNEKYLVLGLGYLTILFESIFLFAFWRKKLRIPLLIIGVGLHIGILFCFPIPFFALGFITLYILMVPVGIWSFLFKKRPSDHFLTFYYDRECPLCNRIKIIVEHLDVNNHVKFKPIQSDSAKDVVLSKIPMERLLSEVTSVDRRGNIYFGLDSYIRVFQAIWYLKPLSWLMRFPGIYQIGTKAYRLIADNRTTNRCSEDTCNYSFPNLPLEGDKVKIFRDFTLSDFKSLCCLFGLLIAGLFQLNVTYNNPVLRQLRINIGMENSLVGRIIAVGTNRTQILTKTFFGFTHHGLFTDSHFHNYNHIIAVVYRTSDEKEVWLPITDEDGTPGSYLFGFNWAKWSFRVNRPDIDRNILERGIRDFTAFWANKNGISLENATFDIRVKKNETPKHWEKDFLRTQLKNHWIAAGKVYWKNEEFEAKIVDIESL